MNLSDILNVDLRTGAQWQRAARQRIRTGALRVDGTAASGRRHPHPTATGSTNWGTR